MHDADWEDIQKSRDGDREAFTRVIKRHSETILRQMRRFAPETGVREDLAQDVFVEAWLSLNNYQPRAPFLHWLQTIATRVGYKYWKELQRRRRHVPLRDDDARPLDPAEEPDALIPEDAARRLDATLALLAPEDRLVLTLTYYEGLSAAQIAERLGWNAALVRMRAFRARRKMRRWLEKKA